MPKISQKKIKQIRQLSVFDEIYRAETDSRNWTGERQPNGMHNAPFYVESPENWSDEETEFFDVMNQIESAIIKKVLEILEVKNDG